MLLVGLVRRKNLLLFMVDGLHVTRRFGSRQLGATLQFLRHRPAIKIYDVRDASTAVMRVGGSELSNVRFACGLELPVQAVFCSDPPLFLQSFWYRYE